MRIILHSGAQRKATFPPSGC